MHPRELKTFEVESKICTYPEAVRRQLTNTQGKRNLRVWRTITDRLGKFWQQSELQLAHKHKDNTVDTNIDINTETVHPGIEQTTVTSEWRKNASLSRLFTYFILSIHQAKHKLINITKCARFCQKAYFICSSLAWVDATHYMKQNKRDPGESI